MPRQPISNLLGAKIIKLRSPSAASAQFSHQQATKHNMLLITNGYGTIIGMVGVDDLYDADGNNFTDNRD